ncbi:MAG: peptidase S1 [Deltaproteobacteria bacterium]|nr:peptidase S1 [Deltaproteobacteria bacterium]
MGLLGALAVSGYGSQLTAQGALQVGGRTANFGVHALSPGFMPDPRHINIVSGGNIDARGLGLGPGCVGWVTRQPDAIIRLSGNSPNLRVYVTAASDTTLLVNTANGQWRCNDDSYGGTNPTVDLTGAGPGQYDVWVGSYRNGDQARGQLHITELSSNHP